RVILDGVGRVGLSEELAGAARAADRGRGGGLKERQFKIMGDVSVKTLEFFQYDSIIRFAQDMGIDILRLDYGFSEDEILKIGEEYPISFNPSTEDEIIAKEILDTGSDVFALHNFYPRPETGLDPEDFSIINNKLKDLKIKTLAFIPGDEIKRTPIYEGLPTLEKHRYIPPYVAYLDLAKNFGVDGIFVGDVKISELQGKLITDYIRENIINIPVEFSPDYNYLYNQVFTIRADSPKSIMRLQESREYSRIGKQLEPFNCISREKGTITMDNIGYKRYSGEIQILRQGFPQDDRVNVIGKLKNEYLDIINCIKNRDKIRFISI
ncbi:MAG TPA: MupG family TIM beta-alpha barrel fold protein, partial [Schnuerera sp.]